MKNFLEKLKQVGIGASPIIAIIIGVHIFMPMPTSMFVSFIVSAIIMVVGLACFLVGVDGSILTMGELVGNNIRKLKTLPIVLLFGLLFGTVATVAEPAVKVLATNVSKVNTSINPSLLIWVVSCGIGIFVAFGLFRLFKQLSIKWSFFISYAVTFLFVLLTPQSFQAIAFDFSGATTGVITMPFILALGVGVTAVLRRKNDDDNYGMIGLASVGPIITISILGIIFGGGSGGDFPPQTDPVFTTTLLNSLQGLITALLPITIVFLIFNFAFIKLPGKKIGKIALGLLVTVVGLTMFLTAINFGFNNAGYHIGKAFADPDRGSWFKYLLIPFGLVLGFAITYTEIGIRVLAMQVEINTDGKIKKNTLIFTLALGLALTIALGMIRILFMVNLLWFIVPMFAITLICMPFVSKMFVGVGFDCGGVSNGTISAAFVVPIAIGACETLGTGSPLIYGFGMIAFIAAIPMVAISVLGIIYAYNVRKAQRIAVEEVINPTMQAHNYFIGIVTMPQAEKQINKHLKDLNALLVTVFNTRGTKGKRPSGVIRLAEDSKKFIFAMISEEGALKMIDILNKEFKYTKQGTGIAFAIEINKIDV